MPVSFPTMPLRAYQTRCERFYGHTRIGVNVRVIYAKRPFLRLFSGSKFIKLIIPNFLCCQRPIVQQDVVVALESVVQLVYHANKPRLGLRPW